MPYDLLSHKRFHQLDLLESNTGKLKKKHAWNSKYYPVGKADMSHLPFMKMLLMVFGDRPLIHPSIFKLRDSILQTSVKRGWTPVTTRDKVILKASGYSLAQLQQLQADLLNLRENLQKNL